MSNAIWGNPKPTSDEHYPLKLLKKLLQDMLKQVPAYGVCLALYDENINQMVVRLHIRRTESGEAEERPLLETSSAQTQLSQRRNTRLVERAVPACDQHSNLANEERFTLISATCENALFPP